MCSVLIGSVVEHNNSVLSYLLIKLPCLQNVSFENFWIHYRFLNIKIIHDACRVGMGFQTIKKDLNWSKLTQNNLNILG